MKDPGSIIIRILATEKALALVEKDNTLTFIVDRKASKSEIREAIEKVFKVRVDKVRVLITSEGKKKAYIKLSPEYKASDIATRLGII